MQTFQQPSETRAYPEVEVTHRSILLGGECAKAGWSALLPEAHDRAFAELSLDLDDSQIEALSTYWIIPSRDIGRRVKMPGNPEFRSCL